MDITKIENLVFSGGGVRGLAYVGALMAFEDTFTIEPYSHFKTFAGTSVGALFALACSIGVKVKDCLEAFQTVGLESIFAKDPSWLLSKYALNSGDALQSLVIKILEMGHFSASTTFGGLYTATKKHLVITVIDIQTASTLYLDHKNEGRDMPVLKGIMGSMALPPLFPTVQHQNLMMMDGGLLDNFPLALFPPEKTLGIRTTWYIDSAGPMTDISAYYMRILSILQLTMHSMLCSVQMHYENNIYIDLGPIKADEHTLDVKDVIFSGYRAAIARFNGAVPEAIEKPMKHITQTCTLPAYLQACKFSPT
jgi:hypothetical protein